MASSRSSAWRLSIKVDVSSLPSGSSSSDVAFAFQLATDERSVIERGAVEGEVFHRSPVAELASERVRTGLDGHLAKLIRNELIRPEVATMPGDDAFRFRHLLIRDAAYDSLPKETRAELHERFASWLDEHVALVEQDEIVGYHLEQAVLYRREPGLDAGSLAGRASTRLSDAGRGALARRDNYAAVSLLERAAALLPEGDPARLELLPDLVLSLVDVGRFSAGKRYLAELRATGDERWCAYADALDPVLTVMSGSGAFEAGREALAATEEVFRRLDDGRGLAVSLLVQGHDEWTSCHAAVAAEKYRHAVRHAERAGRPAIVDEAVANLCTTITFGPTPVDAAERELWALLGHAASLSAETTAYRGLGRLAAMRGEFDEARDLVRRGREPLRDAGLVVYDAASAMGAAFVEEQAEDHEEALRILREGFERLEELGEHAYASTIAAYSARELFLLGRRDEAEPWLAKARELCPLGDVATSATADLVDAVFQAQRGRLDDAERLVRRGVDQAETTDFWGLRGESQEALAQVLALSGRRDEARIALEAAAEGYRSKGATVPAGRVARLLAQL